MTVLLRNSTDSDIWKVLWLRNNPLITQGAYTQGYLDKGLIPWREHWDWWHSRKNWQMFIVQVYENGITREVGVLNISLLDYWSPETAIYLQPGEWGQSIAKEALKLALNWLREKGYRYSRTTILKNNERSIKAFETVGYRKIGEARPEEWSYQVTL